MSAIVFGSKKCLIRITRKLMDSNFTNIIFLDSGTHEPDIPVVSLIPFVDFLFLGKNSHESANLERLLIKAKASAVPVIKEERIGQRVSFA
jgi:hypothetical protein